ncbi:hypothetical protein F5887DRAFT_928748 [Amanita rubescens]|nr:hypothetical protein F5887DRAFT_928748 [Amanita rubescens]
MEVPGVAACQLLSTLYDINLVVTCYEEEELDNLSGSGTSLLVVVEWKDWNGRCIEPIIGDDVRWRRIRDRSSHQFCPFTENEVPCAIITLNDCFKGWQVQIVKPLVTAMVTRESMKLSVQGKLIPLGILMMPGHQSFSKNLNCQQNPGRVDLSDKAKSLKSVGVANDGHNGDSGTRPRPRAIFNNKRTPTDSGTGRQATNTQFPDVDTEMAAASDGEPGDNSNGLNLQKGPNLLPVTAADGNVPVLADLDDANGVQEPCNGGKTANSCAQNSGSRLKLAATLTTNGERAVGNPHLRRASVSEEITLKRKGTDLDRPPAKKPNSAPHPSTSSITIEPLSGAYDDWRDRAKMHGARHLFTGQPHHLQPEKSKSNTNTTDAPNDGITVNERNDDEDLNSSVPEPGSLDKVTSQNDPDTSADGDISHGLDALGHGLLVIASKRNTPDKSKPPHHDKQENVASRDSRQENGKSKHCNERHGSERESESREETAPRQENDSDSEEYEKQSDVSKRQAAGDQKGKGRVKWMDVDDDDLQGGSESSDLTPPPPGQRHRSSPTAHSQPRTGEKSASVSQPAPSLGCIQRVPAMMIGRLKRSNGRAAKGLLRNQHRNAGAKAESQPQATPGREAGTFANPNSGQGSDTAAVVAAVKRKFRMSDLPIAAGPDSDEMAKWNSVMIPRWIDHVFSISESPWNFGDLVSAAQTFWDATFHIKHKLAARGEPVYFLLKQRIYELRGRFAIRAERAVETFFDRLREEDQTQELRAQYVEWAVPRGTTTCDKFGRQISTDRPKVMPYLWLFCPDEEEEPDLELEGPFQHECILDTFALFLEVIEPLPSQEQNITGGYFPRVALALAAAAVERAFNQWRSGIYVPYDNIRGRFDQRSWGFHTAEFMQSIGKLSEDNWRKIMKKAKSYKWMYQAADLYVKNYREVVEDGKSTGRALCF